MLKPNLLEPDGPLVSAIRACLPNALSVYAFGSQITGQSNDQSDLDLQAGLFECYVLSEKTALDAARAGLLQDIAKSGTVYAR